MRNGVSYPAYSYTTPPNGGPNNIPNDINIKDIPITVPNSLLGYTSANIAIPFTFDSVKSDVSLILLGGGGLEFNVPKMKQRIYPDISLLQEAQGTTYKNRFSIA